MRAAPISIGLVQCLRPEGPGNGLGYPFDEGPPEKRRARKSSVYPALIAASFGYGSDPCILLECGGVGEAISTRLACYQLILADSLVGCRICKRCKGCWSRIVLPFMPRLTRLGAKLR